jgi:hypothetical protein
MEVPLRLPSAPPAGPPRGRFRNPTPTLLSRFGSNSNPTRQLWHDFPRSMSVSSQGSPEDTVRSCGKPITRQTLKAGGSDNAGGACLPRTYSVADIVFRHRIYSAGLRILMVWIYNNAGSSVFAAILVHTTDNVSRAPFSNWGSHLDPFIAMVTIAVTAATMVLLWGPKTLARFGYSVSTLEAS